MSSLQIRCNLAASSFPLVTELWGRTVMVPQGDENYDSSVVSSVERTKAKGTPQIYYTHNCMPTVEGFQSIGYQEALASFPGNMDFDQIFPLQNANLNRFLFSPAGGKNYIYDAPVGTWVSVSPFTPGTFPATTQVTVAFVQKQSYICFAKLGTYKYNDSTKVLDHVVLSGLSDAAVIGIAEASGYMIAYSDTEVLHSSATVPTDFVPSISTGAGGGALAEAQGPIIFISSFSNGMIVYCEGNMIAGRYTGNANFPFAFTQIPNSAGIVAAEDVSYQDNSDTQFALTTSGLMQVNLTSCNPVYPDITDFLGKKIFEDYDEATSTWTQEYLGFPLYHKVNGICSRYLVISYGKEIGQYTHALVLDYVLGRFGKLKIDHVDVFQWNTPNLYGAITYGDLSGTSYGNLQYTTYGDFLTGLIQQDTLLNTFALLQQDGRAVLVDFDLAEDTADGVMLLGKYQYIRSRFLQHQKTDVEVVGTSNDFSIQLIPTLDGKTFMPPVDPILLYRNPTSRSYGKRVEGMNISLMFKGAFNLTSVELTFTLGSNRQARPTL